MFFPSFNFFLKRKSLLASRQTARSSRPGCRTLRRSIPGRTSTLMMSDSAGRVLFFENDGGKRLGKYPHESLHCTRFARTLLKSPCLSHSFFDARAFSAVAWCLGRVIGFEMRRDNFFSCLGGLCVARKTYADGMGFFIFVKSWVNALYLMFVKNIKRIFLTHRCWLRGLRLSQE